MKKLRRNCIGLILLIAAVLVVESVGWFRQDSGSGGRKPRSGTVENDPVQPVQRPEGPEYEHDPGNGGVRRTTHRDASGHSPLEQVNTPEGMVEIRRTFSAGGELIREVAFRAGREVPVPPGSSQVSSEKRQSGATGN